MVVAAAAHQFIPLLDRADDQARKVGVTFDRGKAAELLIRPRREIFSEVDDRVVNFGRCDIQPVDEWADSFRVERRMPLARAAVLLAVPNEAWKEPPRQQYVANLMQVFEKRVSASVQRGPLVRFVIGKTTPRIDLMELGTAARTAETVLNHLISRTDTPITIDPDAFVDPSVETRLRRLASHASTFRRDTGIDGRYLGFPFVLARDTRFTSSAKPRIMPVLLWPVVLDIQPGARGCRLAFDREREEIRLNPGLEGLLGTKGYADWRAAHQEVLERSIVQVAHVLDIFGALAAPRGRILTRLPGKDAQMAPGSREIASCAALFNAEFTGQSITEDLRQMRHVPPAGTGLEAALRVSVGPQPIETPPQTREIDRYLTAESDPSQEIAVLQARRAPGLLVEGPPGTGKSQTIVNMVADAIGRGETVLLVCQKQAALKVVQKRLVAEGLGERLVAVVDTNRDRENIVRALREQVPQVRRSVANQIASIKVDRRKLAARIETLEAEIDRHHSALHEVDPATGTSYRTLLGELMATEGDGHFSDIPALRLRFATVDRDELSRVEEVCFPLARLWLESGYENSPLQVLKQFSVDEGIRQAFIADLSAFLKSEALRRQVLSATSPSFEIDEPGPYRAWLDRCEAIFGSATESTRSGLSEWFDFFASEQVQPPRNGRTLERLDKTRAELAAAEDQANEPELLERARSLNDDELTRWLVLAERAADVKTIWNRLNLFRWMQKRQVQSFLREMGDGTSDDRLGALRDALRLETRLRPLRSTINQVRKSLRLQSSQQVSAGSLRRELASLIALLRPIEVAVTASMTCPRPVDAEKMARSGSADAFAHLRRDFEGAIARQGARHASREALSRLSQWIEPTWIATCSKAVSRGASSVELLQGIVSAVQTLEPYQRFRARAQEIDPAALTVFALLRDHAEALRQIPPSSLEKQVRDTIHREALLAWKGRLENARPALLVEQEELQRKVRSLAELDGEFRSLNRQLLAADIDPAQLGSQTAWDDILQLRRPRARRLREIFELGGNLGLLKLRPIWLMNPDVASRLLPRRPRLFDVVIYDEASQMLVEHAVPTLFRASRVVISGDEKQMPPTSFFSARIDGDEDDEPDGDPLDDAVTEAERAALDETWNRREIRNCPDLLQLGRGVLPSTTLQVHYRSKYRELIGFSNSAFYRGTLNVPARHPDAEVRRVKPIEVHRVDGTYEGQTNVAEAQKVVDVLAAIWSAAPDARPTVGVVTFNRKQADVVEDAIESRAAGDVGFLQAYQRERERTADGKADGEDVGFFVKNVENVQGDERDIIVFSTTFGRDKNGVFRRNFGVLGQTGGERRLNVAVTRAREKIILLTLMPISEVSDMLAMRQPPARARDYLQAYLDYASKMAGGELEAGRASADRLGPQDRTRKPQNGHEDGFVRSVAGFIRELGHDAVSSAAGDAFTLDFAVRDPRTGLFGIGIECDAPRHELLNHARLRELWRPGILARAIPALHRVASHAWYHRPTEERARLRGAIETALSRELS